MNALRRTVQIRGAPMGQLDLQTICDKCNRSRAHGNHTKCSKLLTGRNGLATCRRIILNKPIDQHQVRSIIDSEELRKFIVSNRRFLINNQKTKRFELPFELSPGNELPFQ